ncbi:MAG TPA: hypothetical protein VH540_02005 [Ktedonobacterales bacterium]|jgi:type II secretory pathway component HofQ
MKMQRFTGWLAQVLDALPWRRSRRPSRRRTRARAFAPRQAVFSDPNATRWQKPDATPRYSAWPEEAKSSRFKTPQPTSEPPPAPKAIVPVAQPPETSPPPSPADIEDQAHKAQLEAERRLTFARYLVRRGTFNEGFAPETLPAQYQSQEEGL